MERRQEKLFGTDGIRGTPGTYPLTDGMVFKIGCGVARFLYYKKKDNNRRLKAVIGKDARLSGHSIEAILADAFTSYGLDALALGIIPTPGLAFLVNKLGADMGIMVSASHNKPSDNGMKFFGAAGSKLSLQDECWIEDIIFNNLIHSFYDLHIPGRGKFISITEKASSYSQFLKSALENINLEGLKICLDCGWGAASSFAVKAFRSLKAEVYSINDYPCGENINGTGAMNPYSLRELVLKEEADVGFAFDGDGDRVVLIDNRGNILDGDYILAILGTYLLKKQKLSQRTIVATKMSNYGLKAAIEQAGGKIIFTNVGDKYVLEALMRGGLNLGGEQSGHIILRDYLPSPDGILAALNIARVMREAGKSLSQLAQCMYKFPQVLINVKVRRKPPLNSIPSLWDAICASNERLRNRGRLFVRYSGTEPLARVMVEGEDKNLIREIAHTVADHIRGEMGVEDDELYA